MPRVLLVAASLVVVLAGCGEDFPSAGPSSATPSTTPVSTTPAPPELPAAARENTKAGAIAFVRHYVDTFNRVQAGESTLTIRSMSAASCDACSKVVQQLDSIYGAGGRIEGGTLRIGAIAAEFNSAERFWLVLVQASSGPQTVLPSAEAKPRRFPGGKRAMEFKVTWNNASWEVTAWTGA